jgi:flagellar biogenesis protein FliO
MSPAAGAGSGKETATSIDDLAKRFTAMEEAIKLLQPLINVVKKLAAQVADQGQQQQALNLALL